jgi:glycosyltransferase involved in cell wall biosynthesis
MADVTVVVPTHNRRVLLMQTLQSILRQRDVELEVIVVDDGSTDGTAKSVAGLGDPRLRVTRHETAQGVARARNRGVAEARCQWVAFCDDDDLWAPDKLVRQLKAARESGRSWVYTGEVHITLDLQVVGGTPPLPPERLVERLPRANAVPGGCSAVLLRRDVLPDQEFFDTQFRLTEDWDLWIRLMRTGLPAWVPSPLVGYRVHAGNATLDIARLVAELELIERRHGVRVDRVAFYRYVALIARRARRRVRALGYYLRAAGVDRRYLSSGLVTDLWEMARGLRRTLRRQAERRLHLVPLDRSRSGEVSDLDRRWRDEGRAWLGELVRFEPVTPALADRRRLGRARRRLRGRP